MGKFSNVFVGSMVTRKIFSSNSPLKKSRLSENNGMTILNDFAQQDGSALLSKLYKGYILVTANTGERIEGLMIEQHGKTTYFYTVYDEYLANELYAEELLSQKQF